MWSGTTIRIHKSSFRSSQAMLIPCRRAVDLSVEPNKTISGAGLKALPKWS
jgi:hypothetical protein